MLLCVWLIVTLLVITAATIVANILLTRGVEDYWEQQRRMRYTGYVQLVVMLLDMLAMAIMFGLDFWTSLQMLLK